MISGTIFWCSLRYKNKVYYHVVKTQNLTALPFLYITLYMSNFNSFSKKIIKESEPLKKNTGAGAG